jgi:hypothetical protein
VVEHRQRRALAVEHPDSMALPLLFEVGVGVGLVLHSIRSRAFFDNALPALLLY